MATLVEAESSTSTTAPVVRPSFQHMFKSREVKEIMQTVLNTHLQDKAYDQNETSNWTKDIATQIKTQLKGLELPRYKYMVQVVIGENKGAGMRMGTRCLWDGQTDKVAHETFINDSLYCVAVAFGIYLY